MKLGVWLAFLDSSNGNSSRKRGKTYFAIIYKGLKGKASVPTDDFSPKTRRGRNQHSVAFQPPIVNTDVYKGSFFPQTIRDWNALPDSLIGYESPCRARAAELPSQSCRAKNLISYFSLNSDTWIYICDIIVLVGLNAITDTATHIFLNLWTFLAG